MSREKNNCFTSPVLGAAYYPEDWNVSEQEHDIAYMRKGGLKCVRIGEFAWHRMEPSEGEFDFAWLHQILDKLAYAGISVILGTPTATPPIWLIEKDPEILGLSDSGLRESHGGRRHCCSNSPTYRKYSARIVEKMVREFGKDERIVGWQIDNEIHVRGGGCYCAECRRRFAEHLKRKYGTVENLNQSWNLNLFSQWYDTFEQIPAPRTMDWHNPHLQYEWLEFQGDSHIDFIRMQADILHKYTDAPVGSDMMPIFGVDHEQIAEFSDVMQYNHYNNEKDLWWTILWFDYMRTLKERPFWNTETSTCWNGGTSVPSDIRPEGFCRVNSWLPVALGGEGNFYWLWRQHWAGHELMHGSVLYASGRPMHTFGEVQEVAAGFEKAGDFLCGTRVVTDVAMMISAKADNLMTWQMVATEEKAYKSVYTRRVQSFHKDIAEHGIRPDVIGTKSALDGYKLLITPYMLTLEMEGLPERIEKWVREGGTWLVGPMTDIRNTVGAHYTDRETGMLERLTGAVLTDQVPDDAHKIACSWQDGSTFLANRWLALFEIPKDAQALVTVTGDYHSALKEKAVVFRKQVGKGNIIVLGTLPSTADLQRLLDEVLTVSGAQHFEVNGTAAIAYRSGKAGEGYAVVSYAGESVSMKLPGTYTDLLTETTYVDQLEMAPYQVAILKKQ